MDSEVTAWLEAGPAITGPAGQDLAELAGDLVAARRAAPPGGDSTSFTSRAIEVELISGTPAILADAGTRLRAAGARPSPSASKLSRFLRTEPDSGGRPLA
jgi:hypothetical protein